MKTQKQFKTYIGVDLGDRKHQICVTDKSGELLREEKIANEPEDLAKLAGEYPGALVALEVGTHSPWISRYLEAMGMTVVVANPRKVKYISENIRKSDKRDAQILAKFVRLDPELLCPIIHRSEESQKALLAIKMRDTLVRLRVSKIVSLRGMFKSLGIRFPSCGTACFAKKAEVLITDEHPEYLSIIEPYLESIQKDSDQIKEFEVQIHESIAQEHPEAKILQTIPCIGEITALSFSLIIEDLSRFKDPREVGPFLGLVPRRDQSGETDKELSITKAGNKMLRRLLVQCAQYHLGAHAPDSALRDWGMKYMASGGKRAKKKAIVAVARKLAVMMVSMLQTGKEYIAYPNGRPKLIIERAA